LDSKHFIIGQSNGNLESLRELFPEAMPYTALQTLPIRAHDLKISKRERGGGDYS
jgi:hypothetical protein